MLLFNRLINDFFITLLNVTPSTSDEGYLCATDKEGFSTGKRCFLVAFTDGVVEKKRNSTKISQLNLFYLLAKVVLHSSWCSSLSLSIYNCLLLLLKAYFLTALYLFVWWSLIIGLHILRRMYLQTKTSHKTYASLVNYWKGRNVHLKDGYLLRDVKFWDKMSHSQKAYC